ncbi:NADPH:quinone reductase-like Zn-dependent oxidoreductase [Agromyces ramosus]|uniref:NADPH:quinone reductase-like Zn-dependent oxidoreductase n=1 Tax=Agromyces ramosus TaxID=33879 RepID=A0A4Q7MCI0_9MICO|nr:NADP-dependent oxidoreductase [Agromyces ramosus]RZS64608.1 NADPH:quinone reductase-like Zn-dependent oxidoreductase [Agromyces ramosus]
MPHAIEYDRIGGPEVLEYREIAHALPGRGEVLVEVRAVGVNPIEWKIRSGKRASPPLNGPRRVGTDAAGIIVAVGEGLDGWAIGDEVIVSGASGAYATELVVAASKLTRKPSELGWEEAAAIPIPVGTAHQAVMSLGVDADDTFLLHGGSGAVGQSAIQLARRLGATVVATASEANHERLRELGAIPVAYGPGLADRVRAVAPEGIDVALDAAGTDEAIAVSKELVSDHRRVATIVQGARAAELGVRAWGGGNPVPLTPEEAALRADAVPFAAALAAGGEFQLEIARRYPLAEAAEAQRQSETGHVRGKIILIP